MTSNLASCLLISTFNTRKRLNCVALWLSTCWNYEHWNSFKHEWLSKFESKRDCHVINRTRCHLCQHPHYQTKRWKSMSAQMMPITQLGFLCQSIPLPELATALFQSWACGCGCHLIWSWTHACTLLGCQWWSTGCHIHLLLHSWASSWLKELLSILNGRVSILLLLTGKRSLSPAPLKVAKNLECVMEKLDCSSSM